MRTRKKVFLVILICVVAVFTYFYKYQQVINDGAILAEEYCTQVESIIDNKREQAFKYISSLLLLSKPEILQTTSSNFINSLEQTIDISSFWLKEQKSYMDRWDFNFFMSKETKDIFLARYNVYENNLALDKLSVEYLENFEDLTVAQKIQDALKKSKQIQSIYREKYKTASKNSDIRAFFVKAPSSKCYFEREMQSLPPKTL